jgi:hypothetical protein
MATSSASKPVVVPPANSAAKPTTTKPTTARKEVKPTTAGKGRPKPTPPAKPTPVPDPTPSPEPHRHTCSTCGWTQPVRTSTKANAWSAEERSELARMIAEHGPMKGCKTFAEAHPTRTVLGAMYQHQTGKTKLITTYTS